MQKVLIIRTDGNPQIGAGHVMRCAAIAYQAARKGSRVLFAVSNDVSREHVEQQGFDACVIEGDALAFDGKDGTELALFARDREATAILVDSYAVTDGFFTGLKGGLSESGVRIAYIDDAYSFEYGILDHPRAWPVDVLVNYTFGFTESDYEVIYGAETERLVGSQFAPMRHEFSADEIRRVNPMVQRVLITTGSTNPNGMLEHLVMILAETLPDTQLDVVVGNQATYAGKTGPGINVLHDVRDMASLMRSSDMAVSAAGSTLYELCATGTPTITFPMVHNQVRNAQGFLDATIGVGFDTLNWEDSTMVELLRRFSADESWRMRCAVNGRRVVDGLGSNRILAHLL